MQIGFDISPLKQTRWYQLLVRFCLGGMITAAAGIIAKKYGPGVGGLFLAFPAIFPAGATLIEKHERERKQKAGLNGRKRGRQAASVDAAGAAMGSIGLLMFSVVIAVLMGDHSPWMVMLAAVASWMAVSILLWYLRKHRWTPSGVVHERSATRRPPSL
ncbi:MAG TPA: DUF3147 family protein [Dongiaceae bacterium]|nr:DUF3147 family protein [Dongiaceae bacterium]